MAKSFLKRILDKRNPIENKRLIELKAIQNYLLKHGSNDELINQEIRDIENGVVK